jgi:hypothetical protein
MKPPRKNWRETLSRFDIHTKTGREQFLNEVASAYEGMYPARADFFRRSLRNLREVTTDGYSMGRAGDAYCKIRVPTELWLFIKRWVPDFGDDSKDIELLTKVWGDLVTPRRDRRRRTRLFLKDLQLAKPRPPRPS